VAGSVVLTCIAYTLFLYDRGGSNLSPALGPCKCILYRLFDKPSFLEQLNLYDRVGRLEASVAQLNTSITQVNSSITQLNATVNAISVSIEDIKSANSDTRLMFVVAQLPVYAMLFLMMMDKVK
jgi:hypothetical protein